ncbi:MAG: ferrochelatase [Elusimicrobia bacterium]|nr:ferrochelatase [Elusimicrobiota bacterium]
MTGVLLMAYGAAASLDEIPAYLEDIRHGRPPDPALVAEVRRRYERMGGRSPLVEIAVSQGRALARRLGAGCAVEVGMRHSAPRIADAARRLAEEGCKRLVGLPLTPFASPLSTGAYFAKLDEAAARLPRPVPIVRAASFHDHPRLLDAYAERVREGLARLGAERPFVLFTAHSLPARIEAEGDPYPGQVRAAAGAVARRLGLERWEFAYQSRGRTGEAWLGPDAGEALERLAASGERAVLIAPIGFVSEHMETLFDDDVLYREQAGRLGLRFGRAAALNDHPGFIEALADAVQAALGEGTFSGGRAY